MSTDLGFDYANGVLSKEYTTELERLRSLERACDPVTLDIVGGLGVQSHWDCLEMGAGAGSVAYHLADLCPDGRVVAADIDPRFLDPRRASNLDIVNVDITQGGFPEGSFDLIHTRLLLTHLPQRDEILRAAASWLKPGGYLLVEDLYVLPMDEAHPALRDVIKLLFDVILVHGADLGWGRRLPARLAEAGLAELGLRTSPLALGLRDPAEEMWRNSWQQVLPFGVGTGLVDADQADALTAAIDGPGVDPTALIFSAWGRRPVV